MKKVMTILLVLLLISGTLSVRFYLSQRNVPAGPVLALPKVQPADEFALVRVENPSIFRGKLGWFVSILPDAPHINGETTLLWGGLARGVEKYRDAVRSISGILDVADDLSALVVSGDSGMRLYMSFFSDAGEFGRWLADGDGASLSPLKWETKYAGKNDEAWTMTVDATLFSDSISLYAIKRRYSSYDLVIISDSEEGIVKMNDAEKKNGARLEIKRHNSGPDYVQLHARLPMHGRDGTTSSVSEIAWVEDDNSAHMQVYSDAFPSMTERSVPKSGLKGNLPMLGKGDLALVSAVDVPFLCFSMFPTAADPVGVFLSNFTSGRLSNAQTQDLTTILEHGRISVVVVADPSKNEPSVAYVVVESDAAESMDRLFSLASLFLGSPVNLPGWKSAYSSPMVRGQSVIAARRSNAILFGIGRAEEYTQSLTIPEDIGDFADPHDLVNIVARRSFIDIAEYLLGDAARARLNDHDMWPLTSEDIKSKLKEIEAIQLRIMTPEYSNFGIYWYR
ncbi:MAG: hypothetical protein LBI74_05020 [Synergistaceae bacterium]|jgi:hypothetical protein|nr:hypothetical protein [Synergistaceae bacterium]